MTAWLTEAEFDFLSSAFYQDGENSANGVRKGPDYQAAQSLVYRHLLKEARRGPSPFHDNFRITKEGRRAIIAALKARNLPTRKVNGEWSK